MSRLGAAMVVGVAATIALGGGISAWASWSASSTSGKATGKVAAIPVMESPKAVLKDGVPKISWDAINVSGSAVDTYVVLRNSGGVKREVVCTVPASGRTCKDTTAQPGTKVKYAVYATLSTWSGKISAFSDPVTLPAATTLVSEQKVDPADAAPADVEVVQPAGTTPSADKSVESAPKADEAPLPSQTTTTEAPAPVETKTAEPSSSASSAATGNGGAGGGEGEATVGAPAEVEEVE